MKGELLLQDALQFVAFCNTGYPDTFATVLLVTFLEKDLHNTKILHVLKKNCEKYIKSFPLKPTSTNKE